MSDSVFGKLVDSAQVASVIGTGDTPRDLRDKRVANALSVIEPHVRKLLDALESMEFASSAHVCFGIAERALADWRSAVGGDQ